MGHCKYQLNPQCICFLSVLRLELPNAILEYRQRSRWSIGKGVAAAGLHKYPKLQTENADENGGTVSHMEMQMRRIATNFLTFKGM